jgi:hypothetical protein
VLQHSMDAYYALLAVALFGGLVWIVAAITDSE